LLLPEGVNMIAAPGAVQAEPAMAELCKRFAADALNGESTWEICLDCMDVCCRQKRGNGRRRGGSVSHIHQEIIFRSSTRTTSIWYSVMEPLS
jgi:hypothetical protein